MSLVTTNVLTKLMDPVEDKIYQCIDNYTLLSTTRYELEDYLKMIQCQRTITTKGMKAKEDKMTANRALEEAMDCTLVKSIIEFNEALKEYKQTENAFPLEKNKELVKEKLAKVRDLLKSEIILFVQKSEEKKEAKEKMFDAIQKLQTAEKSNASA